MKKVNIILMTFLLLATFALGCSGSVEKGLLQGNILIGPITPVETPGQETTIRCDAYNARKIMIYDKSGEKLLKQVDIECNQDENYTRYRVELDPGTYTVDINRVGIDHSDNVPVQVEIRSGITVKLYIEIDTGIR